MIRQIAALLLLASPALAAEPAPQVYRLTPAERDAAIVDASHRTDTDGPALLPDANRDRILGNSLYGDDERVRDNRPHGEVSVFVGTGGARGIAGTIGVPLGADSFAQFSFQTGRFPYQGNGEGLGYRPYRWQNYRR